VFATKRQSVNVAGGEVPVWTSGPDDASLLPGLVVVPSIFGPNSDLLSMMQTLSDLAFTVVMDPFWRVGGGAVDYGDSDVAMGRLAEFDRASCRDDVAAVARWATRRTNGNIVGLGICFGGPWVLTGAASGLFCAAATWHGSRMEQVLERIDGLTAPLRLHFGEADPVTPPETIDAMRTALAHHPDCRIVVHPGAVHGYSHEGPAWDVSAAEAGMDDVRSLLGDAAT
jgi:carboxymethylenebutenolidase